MKVNEIVLAADDAAVLQTLFDTLEHLNRVDPAAEAMFEAIDGARIVDPAALPGDVVALDARVDYRELPSGPERSIALVLPERADAALGHVSVLSPVGRALLGRQKGTVSEAALPGGRRLRLKIVAVRPAGQALPS